MFGIWVPGNRKLRNRLVGFLEFFEKPIIRFVFLPLITFGLPTLIFLYFTEQFVQESVESNFPQSAKFLEENSLLLFCLSGLLLYLHTYLPLIIERLNNPSSNVNARGLLMLKQCLEKVVEAKSERFSLEASKFIKNRTGAAQVFSEITKPDQQIFVITRTLYEFFCEITKGVDFKVRVVEIRENKPVDWYCYSPQHKIPHTSIEILQDQHSTVTACLRSKSIEIVEDVEKEAVKSQNRRYRLGHSNRDDERGSLICYPVYCSPSKSHPYVISISADKPFFKERKKELYRWILDQFALRIRLEHSLLILRGDNHEPPEN